MATARRKRIGHLEAIEVSGDPQAPWVIFFHGYGADCNDLVSLSQAVPTLKGMNWLFPNGHLEVPIGPGFTGRAWFQIDMAAIEEAMRQGTHRDMSKVTPPGIKKARELAFEMIEKLGCPWSRLVLGGFSQGAMLATELALNAPEAPAGLAILSGTLLHEDIWLEKAKARAGLRFFQSHGEWDPVLGVEQAGRLEKVLRTAGLKGELIRFSGQHEIPSEVLIRLGSWMRDTFSKTPPL